MIRLTSGGKEVSSDETWEAFGYSFSFWGFIVIRVGVPVRLTLKGSIKDCYKGSFWGVGFRDMGFGIYEFSLRSLRFRDLRLGI